ncbi:hypothetical protein ABPG72_013817 [Tetrahymena utriculariae]
MSEIKKKSSKKINAEKPNRKAIIKMKKILNGKKKVDELEGLDDVIYSQDEENDQQQQDESDQEGQKDQSNGENMQQADEDSHALEHSEFNGDNEGAAWEDEDDKKVEIDLTQAARLRKLRKTEDEKTVDGAEYQRRLKSFYNDRLKHTNFYGWAYDDQGNKRQLEESEEDQLFENNPNKILDDMLKVQYSVYAEDSKPDSILADIIDIERIGQTPIKTKHEAVIQSIDFHPNSQIFFTSSLDKLVKIYTIRENRPAFRDNVKLLKQLYLEGMPILSAGFIPSKNEILACGLKKHLLSYNLLNDRIEKISSHLFTQRFDQKIEHFALSPNEAYIALFSEPGYIMILNAKTKQFLFEFKMNEPCTSVAFSHDSKYLFSSGKNGKIYQWDLSKRCIFDVNQDQGTQATNKLRVSQNGDYIATSSPSGIVNIYSYNKTTQTMSKSTTKEILNLTTSVDTLCFNQQNELLLTASKWRKNAIRLVHLPSFNVYQNWPNFKTQLKFITAASFSPNGKYMAVGNDAGVTYLYNFKHYS